MGFFGLPVDPKIRLIFKIFISLVNGGLCAAGTPGGEGKRAAIAVSMVYKMILTVTDRRRFKGPPTVLVDHLLDDHN